MDHTNTRNQGDDSSQCQLAGVVTTLVEKNDVHATDSKQLRLENTLEVIKSEPATHSGSESTKPEQTSDSEMERTTSKPVKDSETEIIVSQPVTHSETENIKFEFSANSETQVTWPLGHMRICMKFNFICTFLP